MDDLPAPETRDWSQLPLDALSLVFAKLGAVEILMGVGLVCHSWLEAAKVPDAWRCVQIARHEIVMGWPRTKKHLLRAMAKVAVDRSDGRLEVFEGARFVDDELLKYIGARSQSLKSITLFCCPSVSSAGLTELMRNCPLLEDLNLIYGCSSCVGANLFEAIREACPRLACIVIRTEEDLDWNLLVEIATLQQLRRLTLGGFDFSCEQLTAIVDGCPRLEFLDVRYCCCRQMLAGNGALRANCARIKTLRLPPYIDDYYLGQWG
ncbi:putative F-box/LRR-repeat protein 23 [Oryza brachyantha]|uniref:putative F-box/LRR-repeat protein 23 n=1 Tax=Oryza brachyantha TaxID=4533 RepID=UPI0003EAD964|nr:putative F-box/LRR-repeat protein 23 [Oryza brachyantha]